MNVKNTILYTVYMYDNIYSISLFLSLFLYVSFTLPLPSSLPPPDCVRYHLLNSYLRGNGKYLNNEYTSHHYQVPSWFNLLQELYLHAYMYTMIDIIILLYLILFFSSSVLTAEQVETVRTRLEEAGQEEVCTDNPEINPEDPTMFTCVEECPDAGNFSEPAGIDNVCYGET